MIIRDQGWESLFYLAEKTWYTSQLTGPWSDLQQEYTKISPCNEASSPQCLEFLLLPYLTPSQDHILLCNESNVIAMCHEGFLRVRRKICLFCNVHGLSLWSWPHSGYRELRNMHLQGLTCRFTSQNTLMICDTVGWNFYHMEHGFPPLQHWLPSCDTGLPVLVSILRYLNKYSRK